MRQTRARLESLVCDVFRGGMVRTELDLLAPVVGVVGVCLSAGARKILATPNAGGSSILSEALSCELLGRCYGAKLLKTETEVEYWPEGGSITDYTCSMFDTHLGVSVTRAMTFRGQFTSETACRLLNKKLRGLIQSSQNAVDRWSKQILHVWATSPHVAGVTERAYSRLGSDVTSNTVVLITVASNADQVFFNQKKTKSVKLSSHSNP